MDRQRRLDHFNRFERDVIPEVVVELATEGLGAAILPRAAADGANLAVLEITRPRLRRRRALAWNEAATSPAGRAYLELAERHFSRR